MTGTNGLEARVSALERRLNCERHGEALARMNECIRHLEEENQEIKVDIDKIVNAVTSLHIRVGAIMAAAVGVQTAVVVLLKFL